MTQLQLRSLTSFVAIAAIGCTTPQPDPGPDPVQFGESLGLPACDTETAAEHPDSRCFTYRAVAGVSMGGGTSSRLGFNYPELFDVVGVMGTPFADNEFFWGMIENNHLGGFCPLEQLEAAMAEDPASLNDPNDPDVWCGVHDQWPLPEDGRVQPGGKLPAVAGSECYLFRSDFNHWYRGPDEGRGGTFSRNHLLEIFHDMVAAYGNPLTYNELSNYFPPGIDEAWHVTPGDNALAATICENPIVLEGVYNAEYNPDGTYPVITFCDGNDGDSGIWDPTDPRARSIPVEFMLAVDLNGNGVRDYAEPLVVNSRERFIDGGVDGLLSVDEPGYDADTNPDPAGDDWDPLTNPDGLEGNFIFDEGETFTDNGLDGVAATGDFGEDNGVYDLSPTLARTFERSPSRYYAQMDDEQVDRLDVWMDAGIRDFINTAQISNALFSQIKKRVPDAQTFANFDTLPGISPETGYAYYFPDYSRDAMGQVAYLHYGNPRVCPGSDDILGDGNHVGPDIVHRLYTLFGFMSARMPAQGRDVAINGLLSELSPTGSLADFGFMDEYESDVLARPNEYGVLLPPDYYINPDERYPVLYFFHGQGMSAQDMVLAGLALWGPMNQSARDDRLLDNVTDFQRAIIIWVDGECRGDDCWTGNFYADFEGLPREDRRYEQAFLELMKVVDERYRTKAPELVKLSEL
jgi:hypothetical protein